MRLLIAGPPDARVERSLASHDTERVETAGAVRERAPDVDAVVTADATLAAAAERAAPDTPVVAADESDLAATVERRVETGRYRDAVDAFYERARERARGAREEERDDVERARAAADEAFERARRAADRTPYDALLDDERAPDGDG